MLSDCIFFPFFLLLPECHTFHSRIGCLHLQVKPEGSECNFQRPVKININLPLFVRRSDDCFHGQGNKKGKGVAVS